MKFRFAASRRQFLLSSCGVASSALLGSGGGAAERAYPTRPVQVIIPAPAGGGLDTIGRILFAKLSEMWGQQFIIENRAGGLNGVIGAAAAAKAPADGYTLLFDATFHALNVAMMANLPYDTKNDFREVFLAALVPNLLLVHPSIQANTIAEIVALARSASEKINFGAAQNGVQQLTIELLAQRAGVSFNFIPYKGGAPALNDLVGGHIKFAVANAAGALGFVKSGTLKAIAHTGTRPLTALPSLPSVSDTYPGFEVYEWNGLFAPRGVSDEIVSLLNDGLAAVIGDPVVAARFSELSVETRKYSPSEFARFFDEEVEKWQKVTSAAGIQRQ